MVEYQGKRLLAEKKRPELGITKTQARSSLVFLLCSALAVAGAGVGTREDRAPAAGPEEVHIPAEEPEEEKVTLETVRAVGLTDVPKDSGFYDAVCYTVYYGLVEPDETGAFSPETAATYGDAAKALYAMDGVELPEEQAGMAWCLENGILDAAEAE